MTHDGTSTPPAPTTSERPRMSTRDLRAVCIFLAIAFGLSWLIALPLWFGDGLASPSLTLVGVAMMATPALAALVVVFFVERSQRKAQTLGIWPLKPARRLLGYCALGLVVPIALVLVALPIGTMFGVYQADLTHFSAFQQAIAEQSDGVEIPLSIGALVAIQLAMVPLGAVINTIPALGEELGWRGWLLPKLMPLGTIPALIISGVIWGLWHAPLVLLGYNYPDAPGWLALTSMVCMCIVIGAVFGWLRLRSGSVWPAALAHGALNASAGSGLLFAKAGVHLDTTQATILGWTGWIVPLILVVALLATGQFRPREAQAPR